MKIVIPLLLYVSFMMLVPCEAMSQNKNPDNINWSVIARLPAVNGMQKQLGLAGVFTGVSNGVLLIAGGSNFADGAKPWQGGKKIHKDDIYVLEKNAGNKFTWLTPQTKHLKQKVAYGASTTIPQGVICAGGETEQENSSKDVFMIQWVAAKHDVVFKELPLLPIPLANACMSSIGQLIYLFGGESNGKPSAQCFRLNLAAINAQWQPLPPMPVAMSHSVAVTQFNGKYPCIYIIGGRSSTASGISTLHNTTFCYDPEHEKWVTLAKVGNGPQITNMSAATGVAKGHSDILLIGGDKGDVFHQIEAYNALIAKAKTDEERLKLQAGKLMLLNYHKGFSRDVYQFNTITNNWKKIAELPFYGQVTTTAVNWDNEIFIPCGEIKPGVRTADITMGKF